MSRIAMTKSWASLAALVVLAATSAMGQFLSEPSVKGALPPGLSKVGIDQRLNEQVPLDLQFKDEQGRLVRLGRLLSQRPSGHHLAGLLQLPDAVRRGAQRHERRLQSPEIHFRAKSTRW